MSFSHRQSAARRRATPTTRIRMPRRGVFADGGLLSPKTALGRTIAGATAALLVAAGLVVGAVVAPASASPELTLAAQSDAVILAGQNAKISLVASGSDTKNYYNIAFRYELPVGVNYVAGSATGADKAGMPEPRIVTVVDSAGPPIVSHQILIWDNVADLPRGNKTALNFEVTPDTSVHPVGSTFVGKASVYAPKDARSLVKFDSASGNANASSYAASALATDVTTKISALKISKSELSPEAELMRGVHSQATTYTLTVENTGVAPTNNVTVVDYLPAGLEFLGCGTDEHSVSTLEEYPGSGPLGAGAPLTDCVEPVSVETINDRPGAIGTVFTKVTWNVGTVDGTSKHVIKYRAGIPLNANEMFPAGVAPGAETLEQGSNLDNNTGAPTRQIGAGMSLKNDVEAAGDYQGPVKNSGDERVTAVGSYTVRAMDLSIVKATLTGDFKSGEIANFTLRLRTSEYSSSDAMTITDTIPNGLCPLVPAGTPRGGTRTEPIPTSCEAAGVVTDATVTQVDANLDGSFTLTLVPTPTQLAKNGDLLISYTAAMNVDYEGNGSAGSISGPTVAGDGFINTVEIDGQTTDTTTVQPEGIVDVEDGSKASLATGAPAISKKILPRPASGVAVDCAAANPADYIDAATAETAPLYQLGDVICFRLEVQFSDASQTRNAQITDFVPVGTEYLGYEVLPPDAGNTAVVVNPIDGTEAAAAPGANPDPAAWNLGIVDAKSGARYVDKGAKLVMLVSTKVVSQGNPLAVDITANLMKFRQESTDGTVFALRDLAYFAVGSTPTVALAKKVAEVGGVAAAAPGKNVKVAEGNTVKYTVDVSNTGTAAAGNNVPVKDIAVWDALPAPYDCTAWTVSAISDGGVCFDPADSGYPTNNATPANRSVIVWDLTASLAAGATRSLSYTVTVPAEVSVSTKLTNTASVVSFDAPTTSGTDTTYVPQGSLATNPPQGEPAHKAADSAAIFLADATVLKSALSEIDETNNGAAQAVAGELITYTYSVTVPAGTTVFNGVLSDKFASGAKAAPTTASVASFTAPSGVTKSDFSIDNTVGSATFGALTFPLTYNNSTAAAQTFTVTMTNVRVAKDAASGEITNVATFSSKRTLNGAALPGRTDDAKIDIVSPQLTLDKSVTPDRAQGGDTVTFTLAASNAAGLPAAYDSTIVDCLPAGLSYTSTVSSPGNVAATRKAGDGTNGCAVGTEMLTWVLPAPGALIDAQTATITFTAVIDPGSAGLAEYTNSATVTGSTLKGASAFELQVSAADTAKVAVEGAATSKTVDKPQAAIGDTVNYEITVKIPKNVNFYDAAIIDELPVGVTVAGDSPGAVSCETAPGVPCVAPHNIALDGSLVSVAPDNAIPKGGVIGWSLGTIKSYSVDRFVTVRYEATVTALASNTAGTVRTNSANLRWNSVDKPNFPVTAGDTFEIEDATKGTADVEILEPKLSIDKTVSTGTPAPGDRFTYTVRVSNANTATTSDAHDATIVDTLPVGLDIDAIRDISGGGVLSKPDRTITWTIASLAKGSSVTFTYSAAFVASANLSATAKTNIADITEYFSHPTSGEARQYDGPSDTAVVTPSFAHITLDKTAPNGPQAYVGDSFLWSLALKNTGAAAAKTVVVTDVLPKNWSYDAGSAKVSFNGAPAVALVDPSVAAAAGVQTLTWPAFADVAPNATIVITFTSTPKQAVIDEGSVGSAFKHVNTLSAVATDATGSTNHNGTNYADGPDTAQAELASADVVIDKVAGNALVAGATTPKAWELRVKNLGDDVAVGNVNGHNFVVTDTPTLPAGVTISSVSGVGWSCSVPDATSGAFTCERSNANETLAKDASFAPITVGVTVAATVLTGVQVPNSATVAAKTYDPKPGNNTDTETITVTTGANLSVVKTASGTFTAGQLATWTIDVTNNGPSDSAGPITLTEALPGNISGVSVSGASWSCNNATGVCTRATALAVGETSRVTVTATIGSGFVGSLTNTATVTGTTPDPNPGDNSGSTTTPVGSATTLSIVKSLVEPELVPGAEANYRFVVKNTGTADALGVVVSDPLPDGLTFVAKSAAGPGSWACTEASTSPSTVSCALTGSLLPGDAHAQTIDITVMVPSDLDLTQRVVNSATADGTNTPPVTGSTDTELTGESDLGIVKTHAAGPVYAGTDVEYTLAVTNYGPSQAPAGTVVTDTVPDGLVALSAEGGAAWSCDPPNGQELVCTSTGVLATGATANTITVVVGIPAGAGPATYTNVAVVDGILPEPIVDTHPNEASDPTVVTDLADVSIVKSITPNATTVVAGESITYTLAVTNAGPSIADALTVADFLPAGFTATAISGTGWSCTLATASCSRATLGLETSTITVTAAVSSAIVDGTNAVNTAEVKWTDSSLTPNTDTDTATVEVVAVANLAIAKTAVDAKGNPVATVAAGAEGRYLLQVTNKGPSAAAATITVTDTLPVGVAYLDAVGSNGWSCAAAPADATGQAVTCDLAGAVSLASGATAPDLTLLVKFDVTLPIGPIANTAQVASPTVDPDLADNESTATVEIVQLADVAIAKSHSGIATIGEALRYNLDVQNLGPSIAEGVSVTDTIPVGLSYVDAEGSDPAWSCIAAQPTAEGTSVTCELTSPVAPQTRAPALAINVIVQPQAFPSVTNVATVASTTPDADLANNKATDAAKVAALPTDGGLSKSGVELMGAVSIAVLALLLGGALLIVRRSRRRSAD